MMMMMIIIIINVMMPSSKSDVVKVQELVHFKNDCLTSETNYLRWRAYLTEIRERLYFFPIHFFVLFFIQIILGYLLKNDASPVFSYLPILLAIWRFRVQCLGGLNVKHVILFRCLQVWRKQDNTWIIFIYNSTTTTVTLALDNGSRTL